MGQMCLAAVFISDAQMYTHYAHKHRRTNEHRMKSTHAYKRDTTRSISDALIESRCRLLFPIRIADGNWILFVLENGRSRFQSVNLHINTKIHSRKVNEHAVFGHRK